MITPNMKAVTKGRYIMLLCLAKFKDTTAAQGRGQEFWGAVALTWRKGKIGKEIICTKLTDGENLLLKKTTTTTTTTKNS